MWWILMSTLAVASGWNEFSHWPIASDVQVAGQTTQLVLPYGWAPEHYQVIDDRGRDLILEDFLEVLSGEASLSERVCEVQRQARRHRRSLERWQRYHWERAVEDLLLGFVSLEVEAAWLTGDDQTLDVARALRLGKGRRLRLAQRSLVSLRGPMLADLR